MNILAIESSCDETACAIVQDGTKELASVVSSSSDLHQRTGGVVPEIAARKQVEYIVPVISECLRVAGSPQIDAIAATVGPGLIGSLLVGVEAAKTLALAWGLPLIPVNHLVGHIYAVYIGGKIPQLPAVVLIVSGGHTDLVLMKDHGKLEYLGGTVDDAAGEAFDKVARLLGLAKYFGGVEVSKLAATCENNTISGQLPRPMLADKSYDFSFSGLKTAVRKLFETGRASTAEIASEFENAVCDVLVAKTIRAAKEFSAKSILLGGGVAANKQLRSRLGHETASLEIPLFIPEVKYCGDTAVYIASAAFFNNKPQELAQIRANPALGIMDIYP